MDVAAQWVLTTWTKRSRGAPGAVRRNACPVAFPLPDLEGPFVHRVTMDERDGFRPSGRTDEGLPPNDDYLAFEEADGSLLVSVFYGRKTIGLSRGQTLRMQFDRISQPCCGGLRLYHLVTVNVAYGRLAAESFLRPPTHRLDRHATTHMPGFYA